MNNTNVQIRSNRWSHGPLASACNEAQVKNAYQSNLDSFNTILYMVETLWQEGRREAQILTKKKNCKGLFIFSAVTSSGSNKNFHNSLQNYIIYPKFVFSFPHRKEM